MLAAVTMGKKPSLPQERYIRSVVARYESALAQIAEERDESDLEECIGPLMQRFCSAIFETFFCFKHSAFKEEKEWRLVYPRFRIHNRTPQESYTRTS